MTELAVLDRQTRTECSTMTVRIPLPWDSLALGISISYDGPDGHVASAEVVGIGTAWMTVSLPDGSPARTIQRNQIREQTLRRVTYL